MKFLFFFMGIPLMIMSFFETYDVLPYVSQSGLILDGHQIELTQEQQSNLQEEVSKLFENSRTVPALGVVFDDMYHEDIQNGTFVTLKFDSIFEVNGLPFDELVFKVEPTYQGISIVRGMNGKYNGRCLFVDLEENMQEFSDYLTNLKTDLSLSNKENEIQAENSVENLEIKNEMENTKND